MGVPRKTRKMITNEDLSLRVRKHGEKQVGKFVHQSTRTIGSLPRDILVDVLARVASSSFTDLFNAKLSCKDFLESTKDDYVFQHVSLEKFPIIQWVRPSETASFLTHCFNKGNSESLFRQGMFEYFSQVNVKSGLDHLKMAVKEGHLEATYVYGMILLSGGNDQSSQQGLNLLNSMKYSRSRHWNVKDCRDKIDKVLSQMWINNPIALKKINTKCQEQDHVVRFERRGRSFDEDKEISSCDTCLWYRELVYFCRIMNVIV